MSIAATIYWISILDHIGVLFGLLTAATGLGTVIATGIWCATFDDDGDFDHKVVGRLLKTLIFIFIPSAILTTFTPDGKTVAAMYLVPRIVNNERVQDIGDKTLQLLEKKLEDWATDVKGDEKK